MPPSMTVSNIEFHVLLALTDGPRHGYGIMQDVGSLTSGSVTLGPGTLYSVIKRFVRTGLVEECAADADRRRCYRLTRRGRDVAVEEGERLVALVRLVRRRRLLKVEP
jgi:DNA-binding PadR family transcriptional regulator